ncbi:unnamed protein product [Caenorhabditis auriculariae]|uniref:Uncharacterized protein n=1 Tax=Caenorhabditis auriculariae TaxID=2777116 RepID=A0A8S1GWP0_9PELO|nr:unnamed protein product [Caenorhabditis auriculariae]
MGNCCSRKKDRKGADGSREKPGRLFHSATAQTVEDHLYKIIHDVHGFSLHDMGLVGQQHSTQNYLASSAKVPTKCGRISLLQCNDIFLGQSTGVNKSKTKLQPTNTLQIITVEDYVDDFYLQMMAPAVQEEEEKKEESDDKNQELKANPTKNLTAEPTPLSSPERLKVMKKTEKKIIKSCQGKESAKEASSGRKSQSQKGKSQKGKSQKGKSQKGGPPAEEGLDKTQGSEA